MTLILKILQVILALSVLIVIHEAGHFMWAKLFGIRVDKFFLFFDAGGFKLLSTKEGWFSRLFPKWKGKETEYGIGWLPLGGYCKINGMIDESMDTSWQAHEPQPYEFRSKKPWQRLLVMAGGVLNNFIFAVLVFIVISGIWGRSYIANEGNCIYVTPLGEEMGFATGDRILSLDGKVPENFGTIQADIVRNNVQKVQVLRGADTTDIYLDQSMFGLVLNSPEGMFTVAVPFSVSGIAEGSPNTGRLAAGDRIMSLDGQPCPFLQDARPILASHANATVDASVIRAGDTLLVPLQVDSAGMIGVYPTMPGVVSEPYNAITAIPAGISLAGKTIGGYLKDLRLVATPKTQAYKSVGSFIAIGQVFPNKWDWYQFLYILALLSIMLGVMNLLPIPGLDGGHIVFTLYEMITGRKPSDGFLMVAQLIGMAFLLLLMFLAFGNDIRRFL